ncbi:MAG: PIN domain-containing protein [Bryobacterales bacterium]|nr:PIN domain-containing protein [Bryobacterales bacterium]
MTRVFLDTSVLVPVALAEHPHHSASTKLLAACRPTAACCAAHSFVETYSTLTRLPSPYRHSPEEASKFVQMIGAHLTPVALEVGEYSQAITDAARLRISGGLVYDYLIWRCAEKARATVMMTWNLKHYLPFAGPASEIVRTPDGA